MTDKLILGYEAPASAFTKSNYLLSETLSELTSMAMSQSSDASMESGAN